MVRKYYNTLVLGPNDMPLDSMTHLWTKKSYLWQRKNGRYCTKTGMCICLPNISDASIQQQPYDGNNSKDDSQHI